MKKMMFILTALICMAMTAQAQTVYHGNDGSGTNSLRIYR